MLKRTRYIILSSLFAAFIFSIDAASPMDTKYSFEQCEGSLRPYPSEDVRQVEFPDSLVPVFINYVGRHGSRYPASAANSIALRRILQKADSLKTITPLGKKLLNLTNRVITLSNDRWGALDSLGEAEQRGIATRMFYDFGDIFSGEKRPRVKALSSYSPRAMMSMYSFTHQLDRMDNIIEFETSTGRQNSLLLRPFDVDKEYSEFRKVAPWREAYDDIFASECPLAPIQRAVGRDYPFASDDEARNASLLEYYVVAGLPAMGLAPAMDTYFNLEEANSLWSLFNLRQYLRYSASTISTVPEEMASPLVLDLIQTTDAFTTGEDNETRAILRFGHAETLMPLLSLLKLPGCRYLTNYFDTVAKSWKDFDIVPMSANFRIVIFKARESGRFYARIDLNEKPLSLRQGDDAVIYPWGELRRYMMNCVPIYRNF